MKKTSILLVFNLIFYSSILSNPFEQLDIDFLKKKKTQEVKKDIKVKKPQSQFPSYKEKIQDSRRNIFILKPVYVTLALNSIEELMPYKPGSSQFISENVVRGENIRLYT